MFKWLLGSKDQPTQDVYLRGPGDFEFEIVGEANYQNALAQIAGPKEADGKQHYCTATLIQEPSNPYDSNAVAVKIEGRTVGYIPRHDTHAIKMLMASDRAEVDALIVGGWRTDRSEGHYGVRLDL